MYSNGRIDHIDKTVTSIEREIDHLSTAVGKIPPALDKLTEAISEATSTTKELQQTVEVMNKVFKKALPLDVVAWMFVILVFTMAGMEGAQWFFKQYLLR